MWFWSSKDRCKTHPRLQFFSIPHSSETQSMGIWLSVNPKALALGFAADLWGCTCCVQYSQSTCSSQTAYHVSTLFITTSLSLATSCHNKASGVEHTVTHLSVPCSSSGCCIERGQDCPKGPWLVPPVRQIPPKKQVIEHGWGKNVGGRLQQSLPLPYVFAMKIFEGRGQITTSDLPKGRVILP